MAGICSFHLTRIDFQTFLAIARETTLALAGADARLRVSAIGLYITPAVGRLQLNTQVDCSTRGAIKSIASLALANKTRVFT
jgi:hypothetical protein